MAIADRDVRPAYSVAWAFMAALIGAAAFCGLIVVGGFGAGGGFDPRLAWVLTPIYVLPLAVYLAMRGKLRAVGIFVLLFGLTAIHFSAIARVSSIYKPPVDKSLFQVLDTYAQRQAHELKWRKDYALGQRTALKGGLEAGAIGGFASLALLLPFGRAFRRPRSLVIAGAAGLLLTALGGFGLGALGPGSRLPSDMTAVDLALRLFGPWQAVLGLTLAILFASHAPGSTVAFLARPVQRTTGPAR